MNTDWHRKAYRRMLVDMHIVDWEDDFLADFDAERMGDLYQAAGLTSVMFYCQSHVGLCYWPTKHGKMHASLKGRDLVGETLAALRRRDLAACGYFSVVFDNWAFLEHPEWRQVPVPAKASGLAGAFHGSRYGLVCPNHPQYRRYVMNQIDDLVGGYELDGMFYDMTFWPTICVCPQCRRRFKDEAGLEIPETIDWLDGDWCAFQSARERWMREFAMEVTGRTKTVRPGIVVYHNFATVTRNWTLGVSCEQAESNDFLGADFYGDPDEQQFVCKLFSNLTPTRPLEFMTSRCVHLGDHERTKRFEDLQMQVLASTLLSGAFLAIDAVNLDGTVYPGVYERIGKVFETSSPYEPHLGGEPVEDVAVYFSGDSKMDFRENGRHVSEAIMWGREYPHLAAVLGACRFLRRNHVPFGVITRSMLDRLDAFKALILPNVLRMDREEIEAVRAYVAAGGRVYASRYTSLTETCGRRGDDFLLADLFGAHFEADDLGTVTYLRMTDDALRDAVRPQGYLSHFAPDDGAGTLRLKPDVDGDVLATLTLPYAEEWGDVFHQDWASIHSSPPRTDTDTPVIVETSHGAGKVIYSAADVESIDSAANEAVFMDLLGRLLDAPLSFSADAHPAVWTNAMRQDDRSRTTLAFLNYQQSLPAVRIAETPFTLRPPDGKRFARLVRLPDGTPMDFDTDADGTLHAVLDDLDVFAMVAAEYE